MAKIHIDPMALETFQRLFGVRSLLETFDKAIPGVEWQEREALKRLAEDENWDFGDYDVQSQVLDSKFRIWVPTYAAYSIIILLDSIAETQLFAYAERIGRQQGCTFRPKEIKGHAMEPAVKYLKKVAGIDVTGDPSWLHLDNLQWLRNTIVHWGGRTNDSPDQRKRVEEMLKGYGSKMDLRPNRELWGDESEVWISMSLCRELAEHVEQFFKRLCKIAGLPDEGIAIMKS
jgi:hypothetical protein